MKYHSSRRFGLVRLLQGPILIALAFPFYWCSMWMEVAVLNVLIVVTFLSQMIEDHAYQSKLSDQVMYPPPKKWPEQYKAS